MSKRTRDGNPLPHATGELLGELGAGVRELHHGDVPFDVRGALLTSAALDLLAVPASRLDATGLIDSFALESAAALMREAGDVATAVSLEYLRDERMRAAGVRIPEAVKPRASAADVDRTSTDTATRPRHKPGRHSPGVRRT